MSAVNGIRSAPRTRANGVRLSGPGVPGASAVGAHRADCRAFVDRMP
jgi:hypothetical protein